MSTYTINKDGILLKDGFHIKQTPSPNMNDRKIVPMFIVIHFAANSGGTAQEIADYFTLPSARASAHISIGERGEIVQSVPFDKRAWHAGPSEWKGINGLNDVSIGIEVSNPGPLWPTSQPNVWRMWTGKRFTFEDPTEDLIIAHHPRVYSNTPLGWIPFTEQQIEVLQKVCELLMAQYPSIQEVVGHDMISPGRKYDPGPCLPEMFYDTVNRTRGLNDDTYAVIVKEDSVLNVRDNPGTMGSRVIDTLKRGQYVQLLRVDDSNPSWGLIQYRVEQRGWVHMLYLKKVEVDVNNL